VRPCTFMVSPSDEPSVCRKENGTRHAYAALQHVEEWRGYMFTCTFCSRPLDWKSAWRGRQERMYCNEFCAETEDMDFPRTQLEQFAARPQHDGR
jgi:hypothetical protein